MPKCYSSQILSRLSIIVLNPGCPAQAVRTLTLLSPSPCPAPFLLRMRKARIRPSVCSSNSQKMKKRTPLWS